MRYTQKDLADAISFAVGVHIDQFDKGGNPYILHPLKLLHWARHADEDVDVQILCMLHDCAEDSSLGVAETLDLIEITFGTEMRQLVDNLTKRAGEKYEEYLDRVKLDVRSAKVKCFDLRHNSDLRRLKGITIKDQERTLKYQVAYAKLNIWIQEQKEEENA